MGLWLTRLLLAAATVLVAATQIPAPRHEESGLPIAVQTSVVRQFQETLDVAAAEARPRYTVVFFGDSLAMPENLLHEVGAAPVQLRRQLGTKMRSLGAGEPADLRLVSLTHSGLSLWSLFYLADSIADIRPEYVVIECNLFNLSSFWAKRDRKILASFLPLTRLPEALSLPLSHTGVTLDEWIFGRMALRLGVIPSLETVQLAQADALGSYRRLEDEFQHYVGAPGLFFREQTGLLRLADTRQPERNRSTPEFSRLLFGKALEGASPEAPALRMLSASLERLDAAGIPVLVYVPPYNLDHLRELGMLYGSRLGETIALVRQTSERNGARFHDAHALLGDAYFRDAMDHLYESGEANGHRALAIDLARAMSEDWERILAAFR